VRSNYKVCANLLCVKIVNRKHIQDAVLSQGGSHDASYIRVLGKFSGVPDYSHGYCYRNFLWAFV